MSPDGAEFTDIQFSASTLWNRRGWVLAGLLLGALAALAFVYSQPETNRSWAQVLIRPLGVDLTRGAVNIDRAIDHVAERELAESFIVAEATSERLSAPVNPRTLRREVTVTTVDDSPVLEFSYADESAATAREIAQAFAESYLEIRSEHSAGTVAGSRTALLARHGELIAQRESLLSERRGLADDDEDGRLANLSAETVVSTQIAGVANDIALLDALTSDPGQIISPAQLAQRSERPRAIPTVVAGALLGSLLGVLAALFFDRQQRERDLDDGDLARLGLAPIGHVPRESRGADAFAGLRRRVDDLAGIGEAVAFTTASGDSGGQQLAPWFAWNLAESGVRVLLISADFEHQSIANRFGVAPGPGLLDALVSGQEPSAVAHQVGPLHVVTSGDRSADPAGVLQMVGMTRFLDQARAGYDRIVVHAPDVVGQQSSLLTMWAADAAVVVIDGEPRRELDAVAAALTRTDAQVLGSVVLTDISA